MHEFILTLKNEDYVALKVSALKPMLHHALASSFSTSASTHRPLLGRPLGLMIEPTESYSKVELDRFAEAVKAILG